MRRRPQISNNEDLLDRIPSKIQNADEESWIPTIDLEYACSQLELQEETSKQFVFSLTGANLKGFFRFNEMIFRIC